MINRMLRIDLFSLLCYNTPKGGDDVKKSLLLVIIILMAFVFSACKEDLDTGYSYLPQTELYTIQNSGGFHREYKIIYKYDEKGNVIKKTEYTKGFLGIFSVRERQDDIEYTYNENGDISQERIRTEDFCTSLTDGHQIYDDGYNYIYNEKQQLIKKEGIIINPSEHEDAFCGYEYEYDEHGNCIKEYKYFANGTKELEFENTYDSQNQLIKKQEITNFGHSSWIHSETEYTYDVAKKLVYSKTLRYAHYKDEEESYSEVKYYYDEFNRLIKQEATSFDSNGKATDKYVSEYKDFINKEN